MRVTERHLVNTLKGRPILLGGEPPNQQPSPEASRLSKEAQRLVSSSQTSFFLCIQGGNRGIPHKG